MNISFETPETTHICTSSIIDGWIVWRCPICNGYERKYNIQTNEMSVVGKIDGILHQGGAMKGQDNVTNSLAQSHRNLNQN